MKKRTFWVLAAGLVAVAVGAAAVGAVALLLGSGSGSWSGRRYLALHVGGSIPDHPPLEFQPFVGRGRPTLRTIVASLDRAASDPDVTGVSVWIGPLEDAGWAKVQELRDALARFRESGKPAYAHISFGGNREYYLATACSEIFALPTATIDVTGLSIEVTFFRNTLDKLGIQAQFESVGRYKNAPNQYTEEDLTQPHREQLEALLEELFGQYVEAIANGRGLSAEAVRSAIDGGPYSAREALDAGLVDELLYEDEVEERLEGEGGAGRTTPGRYAGSAGGLPFGGASRVALVYAVGEIVPGDSQSGVFGNLAGADTVSWAIDQAAEDDSLRAILLRVDSPGGVGQAADMMWRAVTRARERKPVVVSMGDAAASGGYYVAMAGDEIVAHPATLTGSIGVFSGKLSLRGLYDKVGLNKEILTRGRHAAIFSDYRPWDEEERQRIRSLNEAFYEDFVSRAAEARGMSYEELDEVAQGRVWTGREAMERGLVDRLGGFEEALAAVRERAGLAPDAELELVLLPKPKGLLETLFEQTEDVGLVAALPDDLRSLLGWLAELRHGAPMARLPFHLAVR